MGRRIGDDAALLPPGGPTAVTVDQQIAGVHFPAGLDPRWVALRLAAVNLSDLAAVGALPRFGFLHIAAPPGYDLRRFLDGMLAACERWRFELAGGDLARADRFSAGLTLIGGRSGRRRWTPRSAARPGDRLWCGGTLGESAAGRLLVARGARPRGRGVVLPDGWDRPRQLAAAARRAVRRQLLPTPQLDLGRWLSSCRRAAAIDVSDGLALDLHRLCRASGVGARLDGDRLPLARDAQRVSQRLGRRAIDLALSGGEDYVLLFALPPSQEPPAHFPATAVGTLTGSSQVSIRLGSRERPLPAQGWDHLARRSARDAPESAG